MARFELDGDLSEVKIGFPVVPANTYTLELRESPTLQPPKEGREYGSILFPFTIIDDPEWEGARISHFCSRNPDHWGFTTGLKATLLALGGEWDSSGFDGDSLVGARCRAIVGQQLSKKNGRPINLIESFPDVTPDYK